MHFGKSNHLKFGRQTLNDKKKAARGRGIVTFCVRMCKQGVKQQNQ